MSISCNKNLTLERNLHHRDNPNKIENGIDSVCEANVERSSSSKLKGRDKRRKKKDVARKFSSRRESNDLELEGLFLNNGEIDVNYSAMKPGLSLEQYNAILKRLESCSDTNAVKFFDWMRCKGKLEGNFGAYSLILRVLGRREEWDRAEELIKELCGFQDFEQSFQVFNTVIYACAKKGDVKLGSKWFQMMLELGVKPNVATIGMLMRQDRVRLNLENWLVMLNTYRVV